jgi:hypothetical protein
LPNYLPNTVDIEGKKQSINNNNNIAIKYFGWIPGQYIAISTS